tara:strand:- start:251 stop:652 length:402 start_codon:yes stop_codon:yes gene_type:complete
MIEFVPRTPSVASDGTEIVTPSDLVSFQKMDTPDTAYNFFRPREGMQFCITALSLRANKDVSDATDAEVIIYETTSDSSVVVAETLLEDALVRFGVYTFTSLHILVNPGVFVSGKTTDATVYANLLGFYIQLR